MKVPSVTELTCIRCPLGCQIRVDHDASGNTVFYGNQCLRGVAYAEEEFTAPARVVTSCLCVPGFPGPLSVKTSDSVPKSKIADVAKAMQEIVIQPPVRTGDVVCADICDLGVAVVATKDLV